MKWHVVSVLYRHSQDLRHLSPQNGISLKEFETATWEIGLIIYPSVNWALLDCVADQKVRGIIFEAVLSPVRTQLEYSG